MRSQYRYLADGDSAYYSPVAGSPGWHESFAPTSQSQEEEQDPNVDAPGYEDEDDQMLREAGPGIMQYVPAPGEQMSYMPTPPGGMDLLPYVPDRQPYRGISPQIAENAPEIAPGALKSSDLSPNLPTGHFTPAPGLDWMHRIGDRLKLDNAPRNTSPRWAGDTPWTDPFAGRPDYMGDLARLKAAYAERPVPNKPNWLERIAAGGLGAAAGYSNAAGRARPIDVSSTTNAILHPGYSDKLAQWQAKVAPLEEAAKISGEQMQAGYTAQKTQSDAALKRAQAAAAMAHGSYWLSRSEQERNQWKIDPRSGQLYNTITGQISVKPPTAQDRFQTAKALGSTDVEAREYALTGKIANPPASRGGAISPTLLGIRATGAATGNAQVDAMDPAAAAKAIDVTKDRAPRDPFTDWLKGQQFNDRQQQNRDALLNRKQTQEAAALRGSQDQIRKSRADQMRDRDNAGKYAADIAQIRQNLKQNLQGIQDSYAQQWRAIGGPTPDFDVTVDANGNATYAQRPGARPGVGGFAPHAPPSPVRKTGRPDPSHFVNP